MTKEYWITKDNRKIKITDMSTQHIKNVLNILNLQINKYNNRCMNYGDDCGGVPEDFTNTYNAIIKELRYRNKYKK